MGDKWYYSPFGVLVGIGSAILGVGLAVSSMSYAFNKGDSLNKAPQVQRANLHRDGTNRLEEFYTIEGKIAVTEVNGEPILDFLKR